MQPLVPLVVDSSIKLQVPVITDERCSRSHYADVDQIKP